MKFPKKCVFIVFIMFFIMLFTNLSYASDTGTYTFTDRFGDERTVGKFPELPEGYTCTGYGVSRYNNSKLSLYILCDNAYFYMANDTDIWIEGNFFIADMNSSKVYKLRSSVPKNGSTMREGLLSEFCYFVGDVYTDKNKSAVQLKGSVDFFLPPPPQVVVIPVLEGVEELPKAVTTTLKMILPVGLVVFGILLLVYIIRLLILRVT